MVEFILGTMLLCCETRAFLTSSSAHELSLECAFAGAPDWNSLAVGHCSHHHQHPILHPLLLNCIHTTSYAMDNEEEELQSLVDEVSAEQREGNSNGRILFRRHLMAIGLVAFAIVSGVFVFVSNFHLRTTESRMDNNTIYFDQNNASWNDLKEQNVVVVTEKTLRQEQIDSYRSGTGLILNVHVTHHGGTTFCGAIGRARNANGSTPDFACMHVTDENHIPDSKMEALQADIRYPWSTGRNETTSRIARIRRYFHMISWEFGYPINKVVTLNTSDWENPNLVSVAVMRDPIARLLAGDGVKKRDWPGIHNGTGTREEWMDYATNPYTDNYALRVFAGGGCCNGSYTDPRHLEHAKALIPRFTYVLDQECLSESIKALGQELGLQPNLVPFTKKYASNRERVGYTDVYDFLLQHNRLDIELYEWSKQFALVNCSALQERPPQPQQKPSNDNSNNNNAPSVSSNTANRKSLQEQQIDSYVSGTGLILNVHVTHHGGTTFCQAIGHALNADGSTPFASCMGIKDENNVPDAQTVQSQIEYPWIGRNDTTTRINHIRPYFHMISWEFGFKGNKFLTLNTTDWENPNLLSVVTMRDPISRLLAGDGYKNQRWPAIHNGTATREEWMDYAKSLYTNNYALRVFAGGGCCDGADTDRSHLERAKALIRRFAIVLDQECLSEGIQTLGKMLHLEPNLKPFSKTYASNRERIGYDDVYDFLVERNRLDIELYEWSKRLALVNCSALQN